MKQVALDTTSGITQYADTPEQMLESYNEGSNQFEIRATSDGKQQLWHKGHQRMVGEFRTGRRQDRQKFESLRGLCQHNNVPGYCQLCN